MKNLRKIVAILAAVLMMISVLPMSAFAAPGDVVVNMNFDNGSVFSNASAENGYMVFDATTANWANVYLYANAIKSGTKYEITFDAKANKAANINVKINNNWGGDTFKWTTDVTTEWATYTTIINPDELAPLTSTALLMFTSNTYAADGAIYHIDNVVVKEYTDPATIGVVKNGNFENGAEGWTLNASASIENGALKLDNSGRWSEAAMTDFAVEVGTEYTLSWKSQRISGNGAYLMFVLNADKTNHAIDGVNWMNETSGNWVEQSIKFTATAANLKLKICPEVDNAGVILIDDITLTAKAEPVSGQIINGDFETGDETGWTLYSGSNVSADAAYTGNYGLICINPAKPDNWGGTAYQDFTVEVGKTYVVTMWAKAISQGQNVQVQNGGATVASTWYNKTAWNQLTFEFTATSADARINICGGGTGADEMVYFDDIVVKELKEPSFDGFITNGDFEIGEATPWTLYSGSNVSADAAYTGNYGLICINPAKPDNWGGTAFQDFSVEIGKSYEVTMWAKAISKGQNVQIQNPVGTTKASKWFTATEWTLLTFEFTADAPNVRINISGGGTGAEEIVYFDDIKVKELKKASFDGYIYNGDFETGEVFPWDNLWGSCPTVEITEGMDGGYGLHIVSGQWKHVRQTKIAVEPNTDYKISLWAKDAKDMCILVKDNETDKIDILNKGVNAGDEWTKFVVFFNTGDYNSIIFSLMGGTADAYGTFDNILVEKAEHICEGDIIASEEPTCEADGWNKLTCSECGDTYTQVINALGHTYEGCLDADCDECGATREPGHVLTYTPAKEAIDCANPGNVEYWFCSECNEYFANAEASEYINPWFIQITVDCVRPEGIADCATVTCETCGNEIYGYGEHDVLTCKGGTCSKCNAEIEGVGCQNYDTPACEDGFCSYCGDPVAGFGHENGAWAPCVDGECAYGCGLTYPATEDHVDEDANDYCDNCWNHLACTDADNDGWCDVCDWEMPVADVIYGDADGDGDITTGDVVTLQQFLAEWDDVEIDLAAADADGDGDITTGDVVILQQFLAEWDDIVLGPIA